MATIHMNLSEIELPTGDLCKIKKIQNYSMDVRGTSRSLLLSEERMSVDSLLAGRKTSFSVGIWLLVGSPYTCV